MRAPKVHHPATEQQVSQGETDGRSLILAILAGVGRLARRFRDRALSRSQQNYVLLEVEKEGQERLRGETAKLNHHEVTLPSWHTAMRRGIAGLHAAAMFAEVQSLHLDRKAHEYLTAQVGRQFGFLDRFRKDLKSGLFLLGPRAETRAAMYASAAWQTAWNYATVQAEARGATQARRYLASAEHCEGCAEEAAMGWQPIDEIIPLGGCECRSNCKCRIVFR
jgi:hypothetical protein